MWSISGKRSRQATLGHVSEWKAAGGAKSEVEIQIHPVSVMQSWPVEAPEAEREEDLIWEGLEHSRDCVSVCVTRKKRGKVGSSSVLGWTWL